MQLSWVSTELYIIINITINDSFGDPLSRYTVELLKTNGMTMSHEFQVNCGARDRGESVLCL